MPAEVETMAYAMKDRADVPWHGLGNPIDHDASPEEMLEVSGLNWTVSKRPLFAPGGLTSIGPGTAFPTFKDYLADPDGTALSVSEYFALVRDSDNKVLGPAGKEYIPTQNRQAFDFFKKFTRLPHLKALRAAGVLDESLRRVSTSV